jgi:hypothetical protein
MALISFLNVTLSTLCFLSIVKSGCTENHLHWLSYFVCFCFKCNTNLRSTQRSLQKERFPETETTRKWSWPSTHPKTSVELHFPLLLHYLHGAVFALRANLIKIHTLPSVMDLPLFNSCVVQQHWGLVNACVYIALIGHVILHLPRNNALPTSRQCVHISGQTAKCSRNTLSSVLRNNHVAWIDTYKITTVSHHYKFMSWKK